ncbi:MULTISPECIES: porin family protein [unclassified Sphingomonas]|jgi:outer membrane immunogenic protein|nr:MULTISPECIES: porin family protein [unclassified Sphingomonas]
MKRICVLIGALAAIPETALAQSGGDATFGGVKVGVSVDYRWHEGDYSLPRIASRIDQSKGGIGYRGHVGYDAQIGDMLVIGAEAGIGKGGKTLTAASPTGDYALKPGWTWDVSGRAGVLPAPNVLLYGRAGYSWLRVRETTDFRAANLKDIDSSVTEKGFLWGGGVEAGVMPGVYARAEYNRANYRDGLKTSKVQLGLSIGF